MLSKSNIEPLHREQGAYRNWYNHNRYQWFNSWRYWMHNKQLATGGNGNRPLKAKKK